MKSSQKDKPQQQEFVVHRIFRHIRTEPHTKYVVRWYRYGPAKNTIEPAEQKLKHYIVIIGNGKM